MGVTQAVKQLANDVIDQAKTAIGTSAKQAAKTPLDLLEEMLGQGSAGTANPEAEKPPEGALAGPSVNPEELKQKEQADEEYKKTRSEELHRQIQETSQAYYEQKKAQDDQKRQMEEQKKSEEKFRKIENLEKQSQEDYALQAAKDAASAEKRVGAG